MSATPSPTPTLLKDLAVLFKLRLGTFVVLSAVLGWFMGTESIGLVAFLELTVGGYLLTGASNGFNQILEKEADAKMGRTAGRPLPTGRMSVRGRGLVYPRRRAGPRRPLPPRDAGGAPGAARHRELRARLHPA